MSLKQFLTEDVDIYKLKKAYQQGISAGQLINFNKPTLYDWFINYKLEVEFSSARERRYREWMVEPGNHPVGFIFHWLKMLQANKSEVEDIALTSNAAISDFNDLMKYITEEIIINGDIIRILNNLELWKYDTATAAHIPEPPKLHSVSGYVDISYCSFSTLPTWLPEIISGTLRLRNCINLTSLENIHNSIKSCPKIDLAGTPIKSNILGLMKIENLEFVNFGSNVDKKLMIVSNIIDKYLKEPFGHNRVLDAQSELLDTDLDDYAQL